MMPGPLLGVTIEGSLKRGYIAGPGGLRHGILNSPCLCHGLWPREFFSNPTKANVIWVGVFA